MIKDLISVIIPVYNHARRLEESLRSLLTQSYQKFEVIIVDDGSTDNFSEVMAKIKQKNDFLKMNITVVQQPNRGAPAARNHGFDISSGEYVIFWDADTVGSPRMLEIMLNALKNNPSASYVYSRFKFGFKKFRSGEFDAAKLKKNNFIDTTSLIRRVDMERFDEKLKKFQDWDLWLNLLSKKKTGIFIPEVLYAKRVRGRDGISAWLPSFVYKLPWKIASVRAYEAARSLVLQKYDLPH